MGSIRKPTLERGGYYGRRRYLLITSSDRRLRLQWMPTSAIRGTTTVLLSTDQGRCGLKVADLVRDGARVGGPRWCQMVPDGALQLDAIGASLRSGAVPTSHCC